MSAARKSQFANTPARRALLARVHIAKKEMGLSDDVYRASIGLVVEGASSASQLNHHQLGKLLDHFKSRGWQGGVKRKAKPAAAPRSKGYRTPSNRPMVRKIYVLWKILHDNGKVTAKRPDGYVKRMTKTYDRPDGLANTEWLDDGEAWAIIEGLKKWIAREGLSGELTHNA
mgnify:CR=1 FL=1